MGAETDDAAVNVSAFVNADGSTAVEILNAGTGTGAVSHTFDLTGGSPAGTGSVYLTDNTHDLERTGDATVTDGRPSVELPARSLTTVVLD